MNWKSIVAMGAGYALAPWTGGLSIGVGNAIAGGLEANDAKNTLVKQGQQDQATLAQSNHASNARLQPFTDLGTGAVNTLGQLYGIAMPTGGAGATPSTPTAPLPTEVTGRVRPPGTPSEGQATPRMMGDFASTPQQAAQQRTQSGYSTRRLISPAGETEDVPIAQIPYYLKLGAKLAPPQGAQS